MAAPPLGRRRHIVGRGAHDQHLPIGTQEVAAEHEPPDRFARERAGGTVDHVPVGVVRGA